MPSRHSSDRTFTIFGTTVRPRVGINNVALYGTNFSLVIFRRHTPYGAKSGYGFHHKARLKNGQWRNTILRLQEKSKPIAGGKGSWKHELMQFYSKKASDSRSAKRTSIKVFFRVKYGLGGFRY